MFRDATHNLRQVYPPGEASQTKKMKITRWTDTKQGKYIRQVMTNFARIYESSKWKIKTNRMLLKGEVTMG